MKQRVSQWFGVLLLSLAACGSDAAATISDDADAGGGAIATDDASTGTPNDGDGEPSDAGDTTTPPNDAAPGLPDYDENGPYPVGHTRFVVTDRTGKRHLPVEVWYPAQEGARAAFEAGSGLETLEPDGSPERAKLAPLVAAAPDSCTRKRIHSVAEAPPVLPSNGLPLVVFSHCHGCARFSEAVVAERLASHGIAMAAPDHLTNTIYENTASIGPGFLGVRASDIESVLDVLLSPTNTEVPEFLRGHFDAERVGGFGHSFGSVTMGRVVKDDARLKAVFFMAAPIILGANPADVHVPVMYFVAREDNSIPEVANDLIRANYSSSNPPAWMIQVADAGHWSFSDIAGMTPDFVAGCGEGKRQSKLGGEKFTYLENDKARRLAQRYAAAFYSFALLGDERARDALDEAYMTDVVTLDAKKPK